ncbi:hypothetical protein M426DRAFT_21870 [Hypoxylon sp. CI-4A]|nr:hypothetical protein M426DRAFT_21870 [Hypoxylon sp. CI-4A]
MPVCLSLLFPYRACSVLSAAWMVWRLVQPYERRTRGLQQCRNRREERYLLKGVAVCPVRDRQSSNFAALHQTSRGSQRPLWNRGLEATLDWPRTTRLTQPVIAARDKNMGVKGVKIDIDQHGAAWDTLPSKLKNA